MDKMFVVQGVANKLFATESAIDLALAEASQFVGELVQARQALGASAVVGNDALVKATAAIAALTEARSSIVASHNELATAKLRMGIRTKLAGIGDKTGASYAKDQADLREAG
jgi:hypothetical protein